MKPYKSLVMFFLVISLLLFFPFMHAENSIDEKDKISEYTCIINEWLLAGPASIPLPAQIGEGAEFPVRDLLEQNMIDPIKLWPEAGQSFAWHQDSSLRWTVEKAEDGNMKFSSKSNGPEMAMLFCYLEVDRWFKSNLEIMSDHLFKVFLDGVEITSKSSSLSEDSGKSSPATKEISLSCGKHRLVILSIKDPDCAHVWSVKTELKTSIRGSLKTDSNPKRFMTEDDVHNAVNIAQVAVAPDGSAVATTVVRRNPRIGKNESWIEVRSLPAGELEQTFRDSQGYRNVRWSPDSKMLSAIVPGENETCDLWLIERKTRQTRILLDDIKGLSSATWSPTGTFLLYSITKTPDEMVPKVYKLDDLDDRWLSNRSLTHLYTVMVDSGVCRRLTAGSKSAAGQFASATSPFNPDGTKILFLTSRTDYEKRPYVVSELYVQDLDTNLSKLVFATPFAIDSAQWTNDGQSILFLSGQSADSKTKSTGHIPNDYEKDLFILNSKTGDLRNLTQTFAPALSSIKQLANGSLLMNVMDKLQQTLYVTDLQGSYFNKLDLGIDVVSAFDLDSRGKFLVYTGTSLQNPIKLYAYDLATENKDLLFDPGKKRFEDIVFPKIEDFSFKNKSGVDIEGWLRYPANFDPEKKYPLIVHYYGGTAHTPKSFDIRVGTSHHYLTTNGYAVYVLNPSGAPGWGPEFSDLHVNDWGKIVSEEIISGVEQILKEKPFLDPKRVGAYGGSYGGFMTMTLATKTDLFRSLIALYGISNITSYWGAGWWGFWYSGVATAGSFPWNRPDIYVDRSPLFHADKIKTPLLLLHGDADINVPVEESEQMFTALKLLHKEVEYIRFKGENHGILGTDENRILLPKMMLAWWDKDLKDQPEAWNALWKDRK
ncbi:MAG: S9 family peptidase [Candidatus Aminicenantes bacterium]|nr:S9 family peptidase [Candidatus Aminicenantes bacterium]